VVRVPLIAPATRAPWPLLNRGRAQDPVAVLLLSSSSPQISNPMAILSSPCA